MSNIMCSTYEIHKKGQVFLKFVVAKGSMIVPILGPNSSEYEIYKIIGLIVIGPII